MAATWNDFTLVGSASRNNAGVLSVSGVQPRDLIIACSAVYTPYGPYTYAGPTHDISGVERTSVYDKFSIPYTGYWADYPYYVWYWYYYPYYWWYWYVWRYYWWYYRYPRIVARISIWRADSAGTVSVTFSEPSGWGAVYAAHLRVWRPQITLGAHEILKGIGFMESAQSVQAGSYLYQGFMPVERDDLLIAMAIDNDPWRPVADVSLSGVQVQELLDFNPTVSNRTHRIKLWRIKQSGTATLTYSECQGGQFAQRIIPNVEIAHEIIPSPSEDVFYLELAAELMPNGRVIRPNWFEALRTELGWAPNFGLRKRWLKEAPPATESERARTKIVELWKVPSGKISAVPAGEAYVLTTRALAEARVLYHDLGW